MVHPPVTTSALIELDLNHVFHNMYLRCEINFDSDLYFIPVKGMRTEQKRREAQEYWLALAAELQIHLHARLDCPPSHPSKSECAHENFAPRLKQMFTDLRELLETLIPDRDHVSIAENLDVPFVMQQIENAVLDICRLANWLASLIKSHCAPMRDSWVNEMTTQIEEGAQKADMILLAKGIEKLFSVLEAMKLVSCFTGREVF
jgi:T-complex protein 11